MITERPHPIYDTDIDRPPAKLIEDIRHELAKLRGQMHDIGCAYPLWKGWLESSEGCITTLLCSLYNTMEEMQKHQKQWGHKRSWVKEDWEDKP